MPSLKMMTSPGSASTGTAIGFFAGSVLSKGQAKFALWLPVRWVKDPGFLEEMKTHLENLRAAKSGKGISMKGPAKHPGKKRKRRVKKKKARAKTPEPKSMFKDKKQLSQARLLTGGRGVSRQQDVNTLYARRAYIALGGEKPPSPHSSRT